MLRSEVGAALHAFERRELTVDGLLSVLGGVESRMRGSHDPLHGLIHELYSSIDEAADLEGEEERSAILRAAEKFRSS